MFRSQRADKLHNGIGIFLEQNLALLDLFGNKFPFFFGLAGDQFTDQPRRHRKEQFVLFLDVVQLALRESLVAIQYLSKKLSAASFQQQYYHRGCVG